MTKMKAIQFEEYGGSEVLKYMDVDIPELGDREVLVNVKAIGVNYADIARREGKYVVPTPLPFIPGAEIAGEIVAVGKNVTQYKPGMRVVSLIESDAYAEFAKAHEVALAPIPNGVDFSDAVALPLQGQTAYHILTTMGRLEKGETVLVHAAAGGVGAISVQLAKLFGAGKVIATASSDEKLAHAKKLGADHLVNYTEEDWEQQVLELTDGKGVDVALEMVGGDIFDKTLACLAPFGRLVIFGAASGEQAHLYPAQLMRKNQSVIGF
ncbi:zinc-binding dehydrogenase, partial [Microvirga sp. 3-52]|nr:zinc-binding dehydrogenase [Microvirga sp. 3-52]